MRFIMKIRMGDNVNDRLKDPEFGHKMQQLLTDAQVEAAYFSTFHGNRGFFAVVNLNDASEVPKIAEPFFFYLNAEIDWFSVMLPEDLAKAGPNITEAVKKWG